jgi:hypothetical protein
MVHRKKLMVKGLSKDSTYALLSTYDRHHISPLVKPSVARTDTGADNKGS